MEKRASGPFLAEILFIFVFEDKGQTYTFQVFKREQHIEDHDHSFSSGFQRGFSNDCSHVQTVISNHLEEKRKQENDHEK